MIDKFEEYDIYGLQSYYSDFHKDFYGYRPRLHTTEQWYNRDWLVHEINSLHDSFDKLKATPAGREQLRQNGWYIED
jgi:hypothetical protein